MKHGNNFDFLRLFFSFLVVIGHTIILSEQPELQNNFFAAMPNYSVFCFFIISGYLIFSSFERLANIKQYAFDRAKRILPAYFFVVIFFAFFLFFFSPLSAADYFSANWFKYLGANLVFLNFLQPCIDSLFTNQFICAVNGSLWTIKVEIMFYLFIPFLAFAIRKMRLSHKNVILISLYILSTIYFYFMSKYNYSVLAKQFPGCLNYFVVGILLNLNKDFFTKNINILLLPAIITVYLEKAVFMETIFTPFALGIAIFWFAYLKIPLKNFGKYGDFSYGMYLIHFPIIQIFVAKGFYKNDPYIGFLASTVLILVLAILIWNFIEKPFLTKSISRKAAQ